MSVAGLGILIMSPYNAKPTSGLIHGFGACIAISLVTGLFGVMTVMWQHIAAASFASTMQTMTHAAVEGSVGSAMMALSWIATVFLVINYLGVYAICKFRRLFQKHPISLSDSDEIASTTED